MAFSTLRSILSSAPSPPIVSPTPKDSDDDQTSNSAQNCATPKVGNKRKAAFEAWHQKKLAQIETNDRSDNVKSQLRQFLLSTMAADSTSSTVVQNQLDADQKPQSTTAAARTLTTPKLSRHNDAAFYPNIQCILCHEWVCSRNRYMHIESHFQYRPYKCSVCGYDNRKQIFIELHISRVHKGAAEIVYTPDSELEKRAWTMAERCLQHTREVLLRRQMNKLEAEREKSNADKPTSTVQLEPAPSNYGNEKNASPSFPLMAPYTNVYRPKIYNNQRSEKSNLIEESRMLGLIPDFSEVTAREERCRLCDTHVLRTPTLLEEHARAHLSRPSYGCSVDSCSVLHHSRNFVMRHMKEVHRVRRGVTDSLETDEQLLEEYLTTCGRCFPNFFSSDILRRVTSERLKSKLLGNPSTNLVAPTPGTTPGCFGCREGLKLFPDEAKDGKCASCRQLDRNFDSKTLAISICGLCNEVVVAPDRRRLLLEAESHSLKHSSTSPFGCVHCPYSHWHRSEFDHHFVQSHESKPVDAFFRWQTNDDDWRKSWRCTFEECYSDPNLDGHVRCAECSSMVKHSAQSRLKHFVLHHASNSLSIHQIRFQCVYCDDDFGTIGENQLISHLASDHSDQPIFISFTISFLQSDARSGLEKIRSSIFRCFEPSQTKLGVECQDRMTRPLDRVAAVYCQLCHSEIADDPASHIVHLQYHLTAPIYKCRSCCYADVDADRTKAHVDDKHQGKVAYYAETLPLDQELKALRLMEWCFGLTL